jgi:predicted transcriptional regulator
MTTLFERELKNERFARLFAQEELIAGVTELVAKSMEDQRLSKAELARRVGVTKAYVSQLLGGGRNMTLRTFSDLMHAMDQKVLVTATSSVNMRTSHPSCWIVLSPRKSVDYKWTQSDATSGSACPPGSNVHRTNVKLPAA